MNYAIESMDMSDFCRLYSDKYKFTDILKSPRKGNDVKDIIHIYQFEKIK